MPDSLFDPVILLICVIVFLVSGTIKGVLGIGLPTTAMALLTLFMEPTKAIAVVSLPIIGTNIQQFFSMPNRLRTARRYAPMGAALVATIFLTSLSITRFPESFLVTAIGIVMCIFSLHVLSGFRLPTGSGPIWQTGVGALAGICGGLSAIWSPPIAMYLLSRDVTKNEFVGACGFLFMVGSLPLAAGLIVSGVLNERNFLLSLASLAAAGIAFRFGAAFRRRLRNDTFRRIVLAAFLLMVARLILTGLGD
ncbi:MAG: sulfite exporter TauE/SafE family protein [Proteobacteria bacterium]|nr:MAG: sulfite exporter TauE/SafE family protein [Pseudomonadota bacterium]